MKVVSPTDEPLGSVKARTRQVPVGTAELSGTRHAAAARALIGQHGAAEFDAVGPLDHQRQRPAGHGVALPVAQQRGEIDRLAGAIDAALGIDEGVGAGRHRAAETPRSERSKALVFRLRKA